LVGAVKWLFCPTRQKGKISSRSLLLVPEAPAPEYWIVKPSGQCIEIHFDVRSIEFKGAEQVDVLPSNWRHASNDVIFLNYCQSESLGTGHN
jgi:hypothetical protein